MEVECNFEVSDHSSWARRILITSNFIMVFSAYPRNDQWNNAGDCILTSFCCWESTTCKCALKYNNIKSLEPKRWGQRHETSNIPHESPTKNLFLQSPLPRAICSSKPTFFISLSNSFHSPLYGVVLWFQIVFGKFNIGWMQSVMNATLITVYLERSIESFTPYKLTAAIVNNAEAEEWKVRNDNGHSLNSFSFTVPTSSTC